VLKCIAWRWEIQVWAVCLSWETHGISHDRFVRQVYKRLIKRMRAWCQILEIEKIDTKYISMIKRWKSSRVCHESPVLLKFKFGCSILWEPWCGCNCYKWRRHAQEHVKCMLACSRAWHLVKWMSKYGCLNILRVELWSLYSLIWDFLLSRINIWIWTTTTWSNVWAVLPKPSWYEFLIGFLIWTPASKYLHLTTFSNINVRVILSMFLYL
jgi:hypothetical protein